MSMAVAFGSGLISVWGIVWSMTWLVWTRPQFDAMRVERRRKSWKGTNGNVVQNGEYPNLRQRIIANRDAKLERTDIISSETNGKVEETEYYWQSYPDNLHDRIDWVLDLIMNFRGPGWNWQIPPLPSLPPHVKTKLGESIDDAAKKNISSVGVKRANTRRELFLARVPMFTVGYFVLDILKVAMMKDPYFTFGPNSYALPPHLANLSPLALYLSRQGLSLLAIVVSLEMVFLLAPLSFSLILGPSSFLGLRGEAWYYPTAWGSMTPILNKGLGGLWGGWWHQTFRFAFAAPTNFLISNRYIEPRSPTTKLVSLFFAFSISGLLHAGGSKSQFPSTHPWHAPIFFMIQPLGIFLQTTLCSLLHPYLSKLPKSIRQTGNAVYTLAWGFSTGSWLTDDFARGGIWLWEPIPISVLRGLGFGNRGDGWWCWEHIGIGWYTGKHWWESGLAF